MHHDGRLGGMKGDQPGLIGEQRHVADPESGAGPVNRVVLAVSSGEGDIERSPDETIDAVRRISCEIEAFVLGKMAELGD